MTRGNLTQISWFLLTATVALLTSCASTGPGVSRLHPLRSENAEIRRVVQVTAVGTRQEIMTKGGYDVLTGSGIQDADIRDGSIAEGRGSSMSVGGMWFYVPTGMDVRVGDIVEVEMGRQPGDGNSGRVNIVIQVRHTSMEAKDHCIWNAPLRRETAGRVRFHRKGNLLLPAEPISEEQCRNWNAEGRYTIGLYCDWMAQEGWVRRNSEWVKPASSTGE